MQDMYKRLVQIAFIFSTDAIEDMKMTDELNQLNIKRVDEAFELLWKNFTNDMYPDSQSITR